jgi:hypothetical protein
MDTAALNLFLAESSALAVIGEFNAHGAMASALNKRHKVRQTDLLTMLQLANGQREVSYTRAILVFHLILLGGGAYDDPRRIVDAPSLYDLKVKPHWSDKATHNFSTACIWEPMNLWAGWANENQSNNNTTIDPHMLAFFQDSGRIFTDLGPQSAHRTPNMEISDRLLPSASAQTGLAPPTGRVLQRRNSAHSQMLLDNQALIEQRTRRFHTFADSDSATVVRRTRLKRYLRDAQTLEALSTAAGNVHYTELLHSLTRRGLKGLDSYARIESAQQQWVDFRAQLKIIIDEYVRDLADDHGVRSREIHPPVVEHVNKKRKFGA